MSYRTPAQYAADRRRSHLARAKKEQKSAAWMFELRNRLIAQRIDVINYSAALATTARMARSHLNFVLTGKYEDFV